MIQSCEKKVIIQIDHFFIIDIAKQKSIIVTNSTMRLNLWLVRASQFLSQFSNLDIRHKSEKYHVISDALSRLKSLNTSSVEIDDYSELDALYTYHTTLLELNEEFMIKIIHEYIIDESWKKIIEIIDKNDKLDENVAELSFVREEVISRNSSEIDSYFQSRSEFEASEKVSKNLQTSNDKRLIYHVNRMTRERRLCISSNCVKKIFDIAHEKSHSKFNICFEIIARFWYIRDLTRQLRDYIRHCSDCLIMQIRRHKSWEDLQSIDSSSVSFHTIILNFILTLSLTSQGLDCILFVTNKFFKRIILLSEKINYTAVNWAKVLLERLQIANWEYLKIIITDRDKKFLSELWATLFEELDVFMLYSTTYHFQTNESSERTNQTTKIALRYYIHMLKKSSLWSSVLSAFQVTTNNTRSSTTIKTFNEIAYDFSSNMSLDLLKDIVVSNMIIFRIEVKNAIDWANVSYKRHYDRRHSSLFLKVGEWALLKLHHGYSLPSILRMTKKVSQKYVEPFKVIRRIERLTYQLNISNDWKIHSIFSVAQLKSSSASTKDSFNRSRSKHSPSVDDIQKDTEINRSYEVKRILNKRTIRRDRDQSTEYLIRWVEYDSEFDRWYNVKNLENSQELVHDYERELARSETISSRRRSRSWEDNHIWFYSNNQLTQIHS